jgi:deoxyribodipyrimidine photo-lyase
MALSNTPSPTHFHSASLVWLRRDLRLYDHAALSNALASSKSVWLVFVFDTTILDLLKDSKSTEVTADRRVDFIWQGISQIDTALRQQGGGLIVRYGNPVECIPNIASELGVSCVMVNHDYEPSSIERDAVIASSLAKQGIAFESFKDQVIFEKKEVLTNSSTVFSVFTPFKNAWLKRLEERDLAPYPCTPKPGQLATIPKKLDLSIPTLKSMGFSATGIETYLPPGSEGGQSFLKDFLTRIDQYQIGRDFPAIKGVSYLSTHLRFGMLSIRGLVREAHRRMLAGSMGATIWLSELIWRDFYFMILANHPRLAKGAAFKPDYDSIVWKSGAIAKKRYASTQSKRLHAQSPAHDSSQLLNKRFGN